jgi:hypothetical protein
MGSVFFILSTFAQRKERNGYKNLIHLSIVKFMRKFMMLLGVLAVSSVSAWAQTTASCVVVEEADGTKTEYLLTTEPRITYVGNDVTLTSSEVTVKLDVADVKKVYLSERSINATGIQDVKASESVIVDLTDGKLDLNGLKNGSPVAIYSVDGRQLYAGTASAAGTLSLPLGTLPGGMIIVKTTTQTFKIIKK